MLLNWNILHTEETCRQEALLLQTAARFRKQKDKASENAALEKASSARMCLFLSAF